MSSGKPIRLTVSEARRFHRRAVGLDGKLPHPGAALDHHGFIQIDPINVCGRMHDLILRNRVAGYQEGDLMTWLHGPPGQPIEAGQRTALEQHHPKSNILAAWPVAAWPHLPSAMRRRAETVGAWSGGLEAREQILAETILREITARGPLASADLADGQKADQGWGTPSTLAKTTLHKLFFHGRVLIASRQGNRRLYDLPERVLARQAITASEPAAGETARWMTLLKLRQRRLVVLSAAEAQRVQNEVQPLEIQGGLICYCLKSDVPLLEVPPPAESAVPLLLAPLDPLIYDRKLTTALWGFSYTWEVYTPPAKRQRGYYALPVLDDLEITGHIDPKADRISGKLTIANRSVKRGTEIAPAVRELARFLGLKA